MTRPRVPAVALLLALAVASPGAAAGIDCAKAKTGAEKTLCADPALRQTDADIADAFNKVLGLSPDPNATRAAQRAWLATRDACPDAACLQERQAQRLRELTAQAEAAIQALWTRREQLRARLDWPADCEDSFKKTFAPEPEGLGLTLGDAGVEEHALGQGRSLFLIQCDQAAYQSVYVAMEAGPGDGPARLLRFPTAEADGGRIIRREDDVLVGDLGFRETDKTLTVLYKGRGVGDCGSFAVYAFDAAGNPEARELRARECPKRGGSSLPPERWPLVKVR